MSESHENETHEVWGIPVPRQANGRYLWPRVIKDKAVARISSGQTIVSVATEIGANQSLVAKWASDGRKDNVAPAKAPAFVEVVASKEAITPKPRSGIAAGSCDLVLGNVKLTISSDYPAAHLAEILRAVRASQ